MNKYKVEVNVKHVTWTWGDSEDDAREKAELKVFEERMNHRDGDLITGYKVTPLRADALMNNHL